MARLDAVRAALDAAEHAPKGNPGWTIRLSDDEYAAARAQLEQAEKALEAGDKLADSADALAEIHNDNMIDDNLAAYRAARRQS